MSVGFCRGKNTGRRKPPGEGETSCSRLSVSGDDPRKTVRRATSGIRHERDTRGKRRKPTTNSTHFSQQTKIKPMPRRSEASALTTAPSVAAPHKLCQNIVNSLHPGLENEGLFPGLVNSRCIQS